jgi:hypothetical protein
MAFEVARNVSFLKVEMESIKAGAIKILALEQTFVF